MTFHFQQAFRAFILLAFTVLIIKLHMTGEITKLINPKYEGLSKTAAIIFLILFFIQITRIWSTKKTSSHSCNHDHEGSNCGHHHDHGNTPFSSKKFISYAIIVFPLLTGFFLPPKVLDSSIADKKGGMAILANKKQKASEESTETGEFDSSDPWLEEQPLTGENSTGETSFIEDNAIPDLEYKNLMSKEEYDQLIQHLSQTDRIVMDDTVFATYYDEMSYDLEKYKGKEIELTGFAYKEEGLEQDQLVLSRFLITHCVADASVIGFLSEIPGAANIEEDTWISATGVLDVTTFNGVELPIIKVTKWNIVDEPKEPYLYPISIKIL
ncbi:putative membrane protein [Mesobacillus persicus]|uniref:Putative membrane protein n=1 Tax=Mesobacillus persicus TaxID=930146 RepID=A0A1H8L0C5_9BACI|nr:TIGR03943 family protein [Mesobacillus persicus]SEN98620.1 putative membrane protein [Mesobacillus persicus]